MGGHKGEFLKELLDELPEYHFDPIIIDVVEGIDPDLKAKKIIGDIKSTNFPDKSFDLIIVRYVLAWNRMENQKPILKEISRLCRGICIIQHQGADSADPLPLQNASAKIFSGEVIPRMKRDEGFFTESRLIEQWMKELEINYSKIMERRIETLSETFIEKFGLDQSESELIIKTFANCDYINQSTFLLDFRNK
jgi:SAM-dependent methyltransferase